MADLIAIIQGTLGATRCKIDRISRRREFQPVRERFSETFSKAQPTAGISGLGCLRV